MPPALLFSKTPWIGVGLIAAFGNALSRVAIIPFFIQPMFDQVIGAQDLAALPQVLWIAAGVVAAGALLLFLQDFSLSKAGLGVVKQWRHQLYQRLLEQVPGTLPSTSGGLSNRILSDLREVELYYQYGLGSLVAESVTLLAMLAWLMYKDSSATLILLALTVPVILLIRLLGYGVEQSSERAQASLEHVASNLQEGFRHHLLIRSFKADKLMLDRLTQANRQSIQRVTQRNLLLSLQTPLSQLLIFGAVGMLLFWLLQRVSNNALTTGEMVGYLTTIALMSTPAQLLPRAYASLMQARGASKRLKALWPKADMQTDGAQLSLAPQPSLELAGVSFAYADETILEDVSVLLRGPGLVAVTGESGSGKTTLLSILLRFLFPEGQVLVSGQPLMALAEKQLRDYLVYVPQGSDLISGTVRDNLCLGRAFRDEDLWKVLKDVQLEAIQRLGGLDYRLGEDGSGLSGGQLQRLAVARALLSDPGILLLDEPTSNLDAETEIALVDLIKKLSKERLVIAVAHRPALIQAADQVLVLEQGRLREIC